VRFLDGEASIQAKVEAIAKEWEAEANVILKFVPSGTAEIRISFPLTGWPARSARLAADPVDCICVLWRESGAD
jgi:hypothetical protein